MATAREQGKRLALIVEQHGCIYCRKLHEEVLSDPEVRDYIKRQLHGRAAQHVRRRGADRPRRRGDDARRTPIRRWGVIMTPTLIFLPEEAPEGVTVPQAAVEMVPGAFGKWTVLDLFRWVREKGYEGDEHFQKYHARHIEELRQQGQALNAAAAAALKFKNMNSMLPAAQFSRQDRAATRARIAKGGSRMRRAGPCLTGAFIAASATAGWAEVAPTAVEFDNGAVAAVAGRHRRRPGQGRRNRRQQEARQLRRLPPGLGAAGRGLAGRRSARRSTARAAAGPRPSCAASSPTPR